ncbi:MAG: hypothetical protein A2V81_03825 [Candidatus Abawacabacteria bacterium RBG_16_42_10]|uniref:Polysaccharide pyruvyl transferase domain-containing protein n=1 Tax=Candidatus Abawacabacteria bacterium RBG_16_42_10 TaxID=1817814 RepID=A0A1F4XK50_9BACT|nr:MAG: hypothetical protein A2V81_03825 [Candidatus Abawacabacteria bacterium RBG_16_42_10]
MRFCLFGSYGQKNLGDEAIADGVVKMLRLIFPDSKITLFTHEVIESNKLHTQFDDIRPMIASGLRSFFKQRKDGNWEKNKDSIKNSDWLIIGGGGIFHDKEIDQKGPNPLFIWWLRTLFFKKLQKRIIIWSVGIGPLEKSLSKFFLKGILKRADIITVRDQASFNLIRPLINKKIHIIPDPVWGLFEPTRNISSKKVLGINIRESHRLPSAELLPKLTHTIQQISQNEAFQEIWLIPFALGNPDDRDLMNTILPKLQQQFSIPISIQEPDSPAEAFALVNRCSHFIAMRFHSYIFGVSADVPCTLLSYSSKTDEITRFSKKEFLEQQGETQTLLQKLINTDL